MQPMFDERNWLAWLVKVRIIILTFILGIELLVAQFTPSSVPLRLFVSVVLLWYTLSIFFVVLVSFWRELRLQALLQVITDLAMVTTWGIPWLRRMTVWADEEFDEPWPPIDVSMAARDPFAN